VTDIVVKLRIRSVATVGRDRLKPIYMIR